MATIQELRALALQIRDADEPAENTALKVGQFLYDLLGYLDTKADLTMKGQWSKQLSFNQTPIVALQSIEAIPDSQGQNNKMWWSSDDGQLKWKANDEVYPLGNPTYIIYYCGNKIYRWSGSTTGFVDMTPPVINDLTTGGEGDALSAEMGKELKAMIDDIIEHGAGNPVFFIRDGALCISSENFVTVTETPTITTEIQSDGTCLVTITKNSNTQGNPTILYSTDGSTPATEYNGPFTIGTAGTHTIKATAQVSGKPKSEEAIAYATVSESSAPTITTEKTSSTMTITASGSGTVVLKVDGSTVANPYTVSRTTSSQVLSVVVSNKETNKLVKEITQTITVPKITVISAKIRNFVKRVAVDAGGHLVFGEPANFDWSTVTAAEWAEGYDDTTDPTTPTFDQSQVTNSDLLAVLEATQEKYDEHADLLGSEPELDFLGYNGTRGLNGSLTALYSVNPLCDIITNRATTGAYNSVAAFGTNDLINSVYLNDEGLLVASVSQAGQGKRNIRWMNYTGEYSTRFAPSISFGQDNARTVSRDFKKLYIAATNGFLNPEHTATSYFSNSIIGGFPSVNGSAGAVGQEENVLCIVRNQSTRLYSCESPNLTSLYIDITDANNKVVSVNGTTPTESSVTFAVGSITKIGYAYLQMKANSPTLILMY